MAVERQDRQTLHVLVRRVVVSFERRNDVEDARKESESLFLYLCFFCIVFVCVVNVCVMFVCERGVVVVVFVVDVFTCSFSLLLFLYLFYFYFIYFCLLVCLVQLSGVGGKEEEMVHDESTAKLLSKATMR